MVCPSMARARATNSRTPASSSAMMMLAMTGSPAACGCDWRHDGRRRASSATCGLLRDLVNGALTGRLKSGFRGPDEHGRLHRHGGPALDTRLYRHIRSDGNARSEDHTSELKSLMRISFSLFCLKQKTHPAL